MAKTLYRKEKQTCSIHQYISQKKTWPDVIFWGKFYSCFNWKKLPHVIFNKLTLTSYWSETLTPFCEEFWQLCTDFQLNILGSDKVKLLPVFISPFLDTCLLFYLVACLHIQLSVCVFVVRPSVRPSVCLSAGLPTCLSRCLSSSLSSVLS